MKTKKAIYKNNRIEITFPFDYDTVVWIKANIEGRRFNPNGKYWYAPISLGNVINLKEGGFELDQQLQDKFDRKKVSRLDKVEVEEIPSINVPLKKQLYSFQQKGVGFLEKNNGRALLADEMGLGKTIQAIAYIQRNPHIRPVVIITPASVKYNWKKELDECLNTADTIHIAEGRIPNNIQNADITIINYDILPSWVDKIESVNPELIVTDEAHYYKSNKAKRTKAVKRLSRGVPHFIALTGTPIVNRPVEFFNCLKIIDSNSVPSFWRYTELYCDRKYNGFGWDFSGASNTKHLHDRVNGKVMLRRVKKDVLKELPDKQYTYVPLSLNNRKEYNEAKSNLIHYLKTKRGEEAADKASNAEVLTEIEVLKQLAVKGSTEHTIKWIRDFIEVDGKLVVFATHKFLINKLMEEFGEVAVKIDGSTPQHKRLEIVERFQNNSEIRLFIGNIKAAGVGITLTAASNVAFLELPWTPGEVTQAEDRLHRISQKNSVNVHFLLAQNTIQESIANLLDKKRKVIDSVLDGKVTEEESLLTELIEKYI